MQTIIALPFTEMIVTVVDDPTCLVQLDGVPMRIVGDNVIRRKRISIHTEEGWRVAGCQSIPVVIVEAK